MSNTLTVDGKVYTKNQYATLKELIAAYESGELSREFVLFVDNDWSAVHVSTFDAIGDEQDALMVYTGPGGEKLAGEALDLLGLTWEFV